MAKLKPPRGPFAVVLQGGGALGAFELGAMRRLYRGPKPDAAAAPVFAPHIVAGVSIGAITAGLLARPKGRTGIAALEAFWNQVAIPDLALFPGWAKAASVFGNPSFFVPRSDYLEFASWTSFYDTAPLKRTLEKLIDTQALARVGAEPRLILSATDVKAGEIHYFDSATTSLSLDHILASGSLPPSFPITDIADHAYWDGGLFDNTPLGPVLDALAQQRGDDACVIVVNLFPNQGDVPDDMEAVGRRMLNLMFANRTREDLKLLQRFNEVAALVKAIKALPASAALRADASLTKILERDYIHVPHIVSITRETQADNEDAGDFSCSGIDSRARQGFSDADRPLSEIGL